MCFWTINTCLVFLLSAFLAGVIIPQILHISFRKKLYDVPGDRKVHQGVVPRLGGIAFKPVILFSMIFLMGANLVLGCPDIFLAIVDDSLVLLFGCCAVMVLYLIGIADDLIGVRYRVKFAVMALCAIMLITSGLWIDNLYGILGIHSLPKWIGYPFSILIIVFIINAINLIDGIDGLASGLSGVALFFYGLLFFISGKYILAMIAFATLGVLVPFFYYNVFGSVERRKKIFMGDTGSLTIGIILCFLSINLFLCIPDGAGIANPVVVAFSPLIIPCFDTVRVFLRRIRLRKNPFVADMSHIHHKLLAVGMSQRQAMVTILFASLLFTVGNVSLSEYIDVNLLLAGDTLVWIVSNLWLTSKIKERKDKVVALKINY